MQACSDRMEVLMMDVHGELDPGDRVGWESHLKTCQGCRRERDRILRTIREMKEAMKAPELPPDTAEALISSVRREVGEAVRRVWTTGAGRGQEGDRRPRIGPGTAQAGF